MGFTVTPLAQKARTKTLIADSDLNLGNYDLIATDVKGDTAEFGEFVGGVGNFTNVLGSGNLDIEGTGNIKGLTTFQNAVQVNGSLNVEGSINNVNIADNGEITTAQGVNGADFNGATISATKFNGATIDSTGNITGVKGIFSGVVTSPNISSRNAWIMVLDNVAYNLAYYPIVIGTPGSINGGSFGQIMLISEGGAINAGASKAVITVADFNTDKYGIIGITDIIVKNGSWSYTALTGNNNYTAIFNNKTITNAGVSLTLTEVKQLLTKANKVTFKNNSTASLSSYTLLIRINNTSSGTQSGYLVPYDTYI